MHDNMNEQEIALWNVSDQPNVDWSQFDFSTVRTGFLMQQVCIERRTRRNIRSRWSTPSTDAVLRLASRLVVSVKTETACRIELKTRERLQRMPKAVRRDQHLERLATKATKTDKNQDAEIRRCWGKASPSNP